MSEYIHFPNLGYFKHQFNGDEISFLKEEILDIQKNFDAVSSFTEKLAGAIEHEYLITKSQKKLEELLIPLLKKYNDCSAVLERFDYLSCERPVYLDDVWVNFQKKYEYNPTHRHQGIISFVCWINVPYDIDVEIQNGLGKQSNTNCPGYFELLYTDSLGAIVSHRIKISKEYENTIIFFPAKMMHCVYPFSTSEGYRISVSGNFKLLTN